MPRASDPQTTTEDIRAAVARASVREPVGEERAALRRVAYLRVFRGYGSRRRCGHDADMPRRRVVRDGSIRRCRRDIKPRPVDLPTQNIRVLGGRDVDVVAVPAGVDLVCADFCGVGLLVTSSRRTGQSQDQRARFPLGPSAGTSRPKSRSGAPTADPGPRSRATPSPHRGPRSRGRRLLARRAPRAPRASSRSGSTRARRRGRRRLRRGGRRSSGGAARLSAGRAARRFCCLNTRDSSDARAPRAARPARGRAGGPRPRRRGAC